MAQNPEQDVVLFKTNRALLMATITDAEEREPVATNEKELNRLAEKLKTDVVELGYKDVEVAVLFNPNGCVWFGGRIYC